MKNETIILKRPLKSSKFLSKGKGLVFPANTPLSIMKTHSAIFVEHPVFKNIYHRVNPKNIKHENVCSIRKDILERGLGVPVGFYYASGKQLYKYRWTGKGAEVFQIWYRGKWNTAESIDFEFK